MNISLLKNRSVFRSKTFELNLVEPPIIDRVEIDGKRFYNTPDGTFPSVTTVLSNLEKASLDDWKKRVGEEEAERRRNRGANRGTRLHRVVEDYMLNKPVEDVFKDVQADTKSLFESIRKHLDSIDLVYGVETPLYSKLLRTAGTTDQLCVINGKNTVLDLKTATNPKRDEHLTSYYYQATCYAMMAESLFQKNFEQCVLLIAVEWDRPQVVSFDSNKYRSEVIEFFEKHT